MWCKIFAAARFKWASLHDVHTCSCSALQLTPWVCQTGLWGSISHFKNTLAWANAMGKWETFCAYLTDFCGFIFHTASVFKFCWIALVKIDSAVCGPNSTLRKNACQSGSNHLIIIHVILSAICRPQSLSHFLSEVDDRKNSTCYLMSHTCLILMGPIKFLLRAMNSYPISCFVVLFLVSWRCCQRLLFLSPLRGRKNARIVFLLLVIRPPPIHCEFVDAPDRLARARRHGLSNAGKQIVKIW